MKSSLHQPVSRNWIRRSARLLCFGCLAWLAGTLTGCATSGTASKLPGTSAAYIYAGEEGLLNDYAPVFVIEHDQKSYNKIGTPSARLDDAGDEEIFVDPSQPTIYSQLRTFETDKGAYTNLIYRIHFERSPFTWRPFNASAGRNVGAMAIVTLNEDQRPVYLTTVQSCGCYHAITPTNFLEPEAFPEGWDTESVTVYGELLPGLLTFPEHEDSKSRIVITIRDGTHRTKDIQVSTLDAIGDTYGVVEAVSAPIESLKSIPIGDGHTSFYYTKGNKKGLVKGAYKPWETVLFGLWAWDLHVGQDREYTSTADGSRRFYTTLTSWKKKDADMWDYAGYLGHNGWKP